MRTVRLLEGRELSLPQVCFKLATGRVHSCLVLPQFSSVVADFFYVSVDLLTIPTNFCFAGAIADIAPKLRWVSSQLFIIPAQLPAILFDFISRIANVFEILSNLRLIMVATVVMMNITSVVPIIVSSMIIPFSSV